jgi:hypothetical protein
MSGTTGFEYGDFTYSALSGLYITTSGTISSTFNDGTNTGWIGSLNLLSSEFGFYWDNGADGLLIAGINPANGDYMFGGDGLKVDSVGNTKLACDFYTLSSKKQYIGTSLTTDSINAIRFYNSSGIFKLEKCTVSGATKGTGIWIDGNLIQITSTGASYTLQSTDNNKIIEFTTGATLTLPNGLSTGFKVDVMNMGLGTTITLNATTTLLSKDSKVTITSQYGGVSIYHQGSNVWVATGDLA